MGGVVPFLLGDLIKTVLVAAVGPAVRKRLAVSGLVEYSVNNSSI